MLSDEERLVQDSVGKFVDDQVIPIIGECFEHERFPRELIPASRSSGCSAARFTATAAPVSTQCRTG